MLKKRVKKSLALKIKMLKKSDQSSARNLGNGKADGDELKFC
jgi:hypothetical protein